MNLQFLIVFLFVVGIIDTYYYYSLREVVKGKERIKLVPKWMRYMYWGFSSFTLIFLLVAMSYYIFKVTPPRFARTYITGFIFIVLISKVTGVFFFILDDVKNIILWLGRKLTSGSDLNQDGSKKISRGTFIKQSGLVASAIPFTGLMYGVVKSAFDYNIIHGLPYH